MPALSNPRQERFAQLLARGKNASEAYELAGYKPNGGNASELKNSERVSNRVAELLAEKERIHQRATERAIERTALSREWVLERLVENAERAMQARAVLDGNGKEVGEYEYQGSVANRALELLGKELGMFIDRKEVGDPGEFAAMDDADLEAVIQEAAIAFDPSSTQH
jgi:hypothetical protein